MRKKHDCLSMFLQKRKKLRFAILYYFPTLDKVCCGFFLFSYRHETGKSSISIRQRFGFWVESNGDVLCFHSKNAIRWRLRPCSSGRGGICVLKISFPVGQSLNVLAIRTLYCRHICLMLLLVFPSIIDTHLFLSRCLNTNSFLPKKKVQLKKTVK